MWYAPILTHWGPSRLTGLTWLFFRPWNKTFPPTWAHIWLPCKRVNSSLIYLLLNSGMSSWASLQWSSLWLGFSERGKEAPLCPHQPHHTLGLNVSLCEMGLPTVPTSQHTVQALSECRNQQTFCLWTGTFSPCVIQPAAINCLLRLRLSGKPQFQMFEALLCSHRSCFSEVTQIFVLRKVKLYLKMAGDFSERRAQHKFKLICSVFLSLPEGLWRMWN